MLFNRQMAVEVAQRDDRDTAPFFAGREKEIGAFDIAVENAVTKPQAIFRIYQGAPGCGKTSLAVHLRETRADELLFVSPRAEHLRDNRALSNCIQRAALEHGPDGSSFAIDLATAAASYLKASDLADGVRRGLAKAFSRGARLVLHFDEAHSFPESVDRTLAELHTIGAGVPCVVMMTGLAHTEARVTAISGLSRLADNAVVEMGEMDASECAASTVQMLDALNVTGYSTFAERDSLAKLTAELAHKWPQHLHCAQVALCEELLRVDGVASNVDPDRVRSRSDERRYRYYDRRLKAPIFRIDPTVTHRIIVEIAKERHPPLKARWQLRQICEDVIDRAGMSDAPEFQELPRVAFATALIEKGIVSDANGKWDIAIPSMANWSAAEIGVEPPAVKKWPARSKSGER